MTVRYRIRTPFRVAAAVAAVVLSSVGVGFVAIALLGIAKEGPFATLATVVGVLVLILGLLLGRLAWAGRVSASIEEYGLDDEADIAEHRNEARARGMLDE